MRILFLSNLYPPFVEGGAEILAGDIAAGLERLGHDVIVLTSSYGLSKPEHDGKIWRSLQPAPPVYFDRQRSFWSQLNQPFNYYRRYHNAANARTLRQVVAATTPDILYIWEITGIGVNSLLKVLPDLKIPIVFHLGSYWLLYAHSPETEQSRLRIRWLKQRLIGTVPQLTWTSLIAVSTTVKQEYVRSGFDPKRIEVIYNGIDPRFLTLPRSASNEEEAFQLLFVGRIRVEKGILVILKALDQLVNEMKTSLNVPPLHLHIFGDGDETYISELKTFLHETGLTEIVTFHGKVPQDELIRHYDRCDLMLVPSLWQEPFGLVVAEAMARGLPVIASNVGGPAEILTHEINGLLVEAGDERTLALAIIELIKNPEKRKRFGQAARSTVQERFVIEENASRVEQHLQRAINSVILSEAKDPGGIMQGNRYPGQFPNQPRPRTGLWLLIILVIALLVGVSVFGIFYFGVFSNTGGGLVGVSPTSGNKTPPPSGPCGANSPYGFTTIHADQQLVGYYKQLNVCWVRYQFHWDKIELKPAVYDWSQVDAAIATMNAANIHVDFAIQSAPQWDLVQNCFGVPYLTGPTQMAQFATILATRYDGKHGHGKIDSFEIGNEEYDQHYTGDPVTSEQCRQASNYGPVLKAGYLAIKAVDPNVTVGMFGQWLRNIDHINTFFTDLFTGGYGPYMDYLNFHFYNGGRDPSQSYGSVPSFNQWWQTIHQIATKYGFASKPIWVTEVGWPTHPTIHPEQPVAPDVQAQYLQYIMDQASQSKVVQKVFWFTINYGNQGDNISPPGGPLPAFNAYQSFVQQKPTWN